MSSRSTASSKSGSTRSSMEGDAQHKSMLQQMLAALSFEHHAPSMRLSSSNKSETSNGSSERSNRSRRSSRKNSKKLESSLSSSLHVCTNTVLHGQLDPDGSVETVFYDAMEFGDGSHGDEFKVEYRRESIVLSSILANISSESDMEMTLVDDDADSDALVLPPEHEQVYPSGSHKNLRRSALPSSWVGPAPPPKPPKELPLRFLRAGKNHADEGLERYQATLQWRKEQKMDTILREPFEDFDLIKQHFPSFCHLRGKHNEPCYYEQPPRTNLKALREGGVTLDRLLRFYAMLTEFQWQCVERDDLARSIYVVDLDGIGFGDFVGEVVDFTKRASSFTGQHYPERAGYVFVINVPAWFKIIWTVVKPMVDDVTLAKISILRGKDEICNAMQERIPLENIPPEYGGTSMPLGESPEEDLLVDLIRHNNALARGEAVCKGSCGSPPCHFCSWVPARSY